MVITEIIRRSGQIVHWNFIYTHTQNYTYVTITTIITNTCGELLLLFIGADADLVFADFSPVTLSIIFCISFEKWHFRKLCITVEDDNNSNAFGNDDNGSRKICMFFVTVFDSNTGCKTSHIAMDARNKADSPSYRKLSLYKNNIHFKNLSEWVSIILQK